jgi:hypothetical protein
MVVKREFYDCISKQNVHPKDITKDYTELVESHRYRRITNAPVLAKPALKVSYNCYAIIDEKKHDPEDLQNRYDELTENARPKDSVYRDFIQIAKTSQRPILDSDSEEQAAEKVQNAIDGPCSFVKKLQSTKITTDNVLNANYTRIVGGICVTSVVCANQVLKCMEESHSFDHCMKLEDEVGECMERFVIPKVNKLRV